MIGETKMAITPSTSGSRIVHVDERNQVVRVGHEIALGAS